MSFQGKAVRHGMRWACLVGALYGCAASDEPESGASGVADTAAAGRPSTAPADIIETATSAGQFTQLAAALERADLVTTLRGKGPFTVFAPTDAAFGALPDGTLERLDKAQLTQILLYHVVPGAVRAADVSAGPVQTAAGLTAFLGTEGGVDVNGANVTMADVVASNGVIHVIDAVILPPDLVEAAELAGNFETLTGALRAADLVDTLKGEGPFTVFAPTDAAFAALPPGTVEGLSPAELKDMLLYHVVRGSVRSTDLTAGSVDTLASPNAVRVTLEGGVKINDSSVVLPDVVTRNGVIHVIDSVLLPD